MCCGWGQVRIVAHVRTNSIVYPSLDRDAELRSDAISTADQQRIGVTRRLEIEDAAKAANFGVRTWATC